MKGISRQGLDEQFEAEEARKSRLILEARLMREQQHDAAAAARFAEAADIEERLAEWCEAETLFEKSFVHRFSAAGCWAQAGNFYRAITLCDDLFSRADLPPRLRERVQTYADTLRNRRAQWYAELVAEVGAADG